MKEKLAGEISVLSSEIQKRQNEIKDLQDKISELANLNKYDEGVLKLRKEQLSKIKS